MPPPAGTDAADARQEQADLAPVQIKPDMTVFGTADDADMAAAQEDWRKLQAAKAVRLVQPTEADDLLNHQSNSVAEDLAMIVLAVHAGDDAALQAAQQRLVQHVLKL